MVTNAYEYRFIFSPPSLSLLLLIRGIYMFYNIVHTVQQFKNWRKGKANRDFYPQKGKFFSSQINCGEVSSKCKTVEGLI